jgi:hypothetical protein
MKQWQTPSPKKSPPPFSASKPAPLSKDEFLISPSSSQDFHSQRRNSNASSNSSKKKNGEDLKFIPHYTLLQVRHPFVLSDIWGDEPLKFNTTPVESINRSAALRRQFRRECQRVWDGILQDGEGSVWSS